MDLTFYSILSWILAGYLALLPMSNPFSTVPMLVILTKGKPSKFQRIQGDKATFWGAIIMLVTLLVGAFIMKFFNISIPALRIAGGMIISFYGFNMLLKNNRGNGSELIEGTDDYSLVPLAMPSLVGPGTISIIITFATQINEQGKILGMIIGYSVMILSILATSLTSFFVLRSSNVIMKVLGIKGIEIMTKFMGLILICIGVQFFADGIDGFVMKYIRKI
jgi:multiple antibiotic resistance protein